MNRRMCVLLRNLMFVFFCFSRFVINIPEEDRADLVRLCFQIELAHWFYLDFYCPDESYNVHPCGMKEFAAHIFQVLLESF